MWGLHNCKWLPSFDDGLLGTRDRRKVQLSCPASGGDVTMLLSDPRTRIAELPRASKKCDVLVLTYTTLSVGAAPTTMDGRHSIAIDR
jgi:hypothetical protein